MNIYGKGNLLSGNGKGILYKNQHLRPDEPGCPSLSPAHAESGPGMTVIFLQDLGSFLLSKPVGAPAVGGTDPWGISRVQTVR